MTGHVFTADIEPLLRGHLDIERTERGLLPLRLPQWTRAQYADQRIEFVMTQPAGIRLVFRTAATAIELETLPTKGAYRGVPQQPDRLYDLVIDGEVVDQGTVPGGNLRLADMTLENLELIPGEPGVLRFDGLSAVDKTVEIWLPFAETTELVALRTDAPVRPVADTGRTVWLHHGSSISHGSNAERPTGIWPVVAARKAGVELVNLGFGGSALLDPFVARSIRDAKADVISLKLGINLTNGDLMRLRAFGPAVHGFLDTIREGHPDTPLLVISPIHCPIQEDTPGPVLPDFSTGALRFKAGGDPGEVPAGKLTLSVIRRELEAIVAARTDENLHYLDGRSLYGPEDFAEHPLPDDLHPGPETHVSMGERFAALPLLRS
ncbi:lipase [Pseudonocardiaceae bacterium YIM PH 21723]|nr:lipase [Pseudonocardiaceae bacterium YIM PH 21723]